MTRLYATSRDVSSKIALRRYKGNVTLRRVEKGWDATGLLKPLWDGLDGQRDELAALTKISGTTLSNYNAGSRSLGLANARKIAEALKISLAELGAPEVMADDARSMTLRRRQEAFEVRATADLVKLRKDLAAAIRRIRVLEQQARLAEQKAESQR